MRANNASGDQPVAGGRMGDETGRNGHFDGDFFVGGNALYGNERASGTDVDGGAKFEQGSAFGISAVYKNGKCDRQSLPATGLVLGFAHD